MILHTLSCHLLPWRAAPYINTVCDASMHPIGSCPSSAAAALGWHHTSHCPSCGCRCLFADPAHFNHNGCDGAAIRWCMHASAAGPQRAAGGATGGAAVLGRAGRGPAASWWRSQSDDKAEGAVMTPHGELWERNVDGQNALALPDGGRLARVRGFKSRPTRLHGHYQAITTTCKASKPLRALLLRDTTPPSRTQATEACVDSCNQLCIATRPPT